MTTEIEKLRNALENAAAGLEWCARRDAGRMASPNLHDYPEKWAREAYEALDASDSLSFAIRSERNTAIMSALDMAAAEAGNTDHQGAEDEEGCWDDYSAIEAQRSICKAIRAITVQDVLDKIGGAA